MWSLYISSIDSTSGSNPINLAKQTTVITTPAINSVKATLEIVVINVLSFTSVVSNVAKHKTLSFIYSNKGELNEIFDIILIDIYIDAYQNIISK